MKKAIYTAVLLTALLASCRKQQLPEQVINSPEFYAKFTIDGAEQLIEAGNNDYYMYSNHVLDTSSDINLFKAEIKKQSCSNCDYALTILVSDTRHNSAETRMQTDSALMDGNHLYNDPSTETLHHQVTLTPAKAFVAGTTHSWTIVDMANGSQTTFNSYSVSTMLDVKKKYAITYYYSNNQGSCDASLTNTYRVGYPLQAEISAIKQGSQSQHLFSFSGNARGVGTLSYNWDFGDGSPVSTEANPVHVYPFKSFSPYLAKLRVIDGASDTCFSNYHIYGSPDNVCEANFSAAFTPVFNPKIFGSVTILLTDKDGNVYSSKGFSQPGDSRFNIVSVEDYKTNERAQPTKKLKVTFNCRLQNGSKSINLSNAEAVIAVSYK